MLAQETEDQKLKSEIDEIMARVDRILEKIENQDPGIKLKNEPSGD